MNKRPLIVTVLSILFILLGVGLVASAVSMFGFWRGTQPISADELRDLRYVAITGVLALVSGIFMLRGNNWARWLCALWLAAHVVLSFWHDWFEFVIHGLMFLVLFYVLFWSNAARYFSAKSDAN